MTAEGTQTTQRRNTKTAARHGKMTGLYNPFADWTLQDPCQGFSQELYKRGRSWTQHNEQTQGSCSPGGTTNIG